MKEVIISTEAVNCYGYRVLTSGIDTSQYEKNPVLLWMHRRSFEPGAMPIGRIENLRVEGEQLIGTPVFDGEDAFAKQIESKWENGFLRMASAAFEIQETSDAPELVSMGQTRETVTRCKLIEVSIVDIGGNDEALQLYQDGKLLQLAKATPELRRGRIANGEQETETDTTNNKTNKMNMTKEQLQLLGLPEGATDEQATAALGLLKTKADNADALTLAAVTQAVDTAIAERRILAGQRDHFINLGKTAGVQMLTDTLKTMAPQQKPTDQLNLGKQSAPGAGNAPATYAKLSDVPREKLLELRKEQPAEYARLYKAEYGTDCPTLEQ